MSAITACLAGACPNPWLYPPFPHGCHWNLALEQSIRVRYSYRLRSVPRNRWECGALFIDCTKDLLTVGLLPYPLSRSQPRLPLPSSPYISYTITTGTLISRREAFYVTYFAEGGCRHLILNFRMTQRCLLMLLYLPPPRFKPALTKKHLKKTLSDPILRFVGLLCLVLINILLLVDVELTPISQGHFQFDGEGSWGFRQFLALLVVPLQDFVTSLVDIEMARRIKNAIFTMVAKSTFFVSFKSHFMLLIFAGFLVLHASQERIQAGETNSPGVRVEFRLCRGPLAWRG